MANINSAPQSDKSAKSKIIAAIRAALKKEFETFQQASRQTRQSGSDDESRADGKYDTQSTEANYLADGQARQAEELAQAAVTFDTLEARDFKKFEPVDLGALVELEIAGASNWFFLAPASGGLEIELDSRSITVITPDSPLAAQMIGKHSGDQISSAQAKILSIA